MMEMVNLPLILAAAFVAAASPGPATLAIAGTSMKSGRRLGLALAAGVTTGSLTWSCIAAFGLGALMLANVWVFEAIRYVGAGYLMYLAFKSAKSALTPGESAARPLSVTSAGRAFGKGLALHLTNPKAVLFFGSLYAIGIPPGVSPAVLLAVMAALALQSALIFHGYALLFSSKPMILGYMRLRRWFEGVFAVAFGAAGLKVLTARIQ